MNKKWMFMLVLPLMFMGTLAKMAHADLTTFSEEVKILDADNPNHNPDPNHGHTPPEHVMRFACPAPDAVRCVPSEHQIGVWTSNGGQMTGNTFMPNNECANVIKSNSHSRLFCCYTKCGVFFHDVPYEKCDKTDQSNFVCHP